MARQLESWIDGFERYTEQLNSPPIFRKWVGIFTLACALERRVWAKMGPGILYPNLYLFLVGPPGAGKTAAANVARNLLMGIDDLHVAPTSVTRASLIDNLKEAERKVVRPRESPPIIEFNSLALLSNELGVLLPSYENDFMNVLTDLYDCHVYTESRRSKDTRIAIPAPQLNLMAATTPSYLNNLLPQGAWDQGFLSRTIMVYAGTPPRRSVFEDVTLATDLQKRLEHDLNEIYGLFGKVDFDPEVVAAVDAWHLSGGKPVPDHPKLQHYNTRRTAHLIKLMCISCVARSDDLVVVIDDFVEAMGWMSEAEAAMPDIFKSMVSGGDSQVIAETWHFAYKMYVKNQVPITEQRLAMFLQERTPAHNIRNILEVMERAGILEEKMVQGVGKAFIPKPLQ
jgi:hypothetical protein